MTPSFQKLPVAGSTRRGELSSPRRVWSAALLLAVAAVVLLPVSALAHSAFVRSEPAPGSVLTDAPEVVTIWFTEPVDPRLATIDVLDSAGNRVSTEAVTGLPGDRNAISLKLPRLPDGTYTVTWTNASSSDGHPINGSFVFSIGTPPGTPPTPAPGAGEAEAPLLQSPFEPVLRWIGLISILAIVGCLVFELLISRPVLGGGGDNPLVEMAKPMESRTLSLACVAAAVFLLASVGEMVVKVAQFSGIAGLQTGGTPLSVFLTQTEWGRLWIWRLSTLLGLAAVLVLAGVDRRRRGLSGGREWQIVALPLACGALLTLSLASHGGSLGEFKAAAVVSDFLHLLAAGAWTGGIFYFALIVPPAMIAWRRKNAGGAGPGSKETAPAAYCPANHVTAIGRFSALATASIGVLFVTGLFNSWAQVRTLSALTTPYGVTLISKLALLAPLLLLGAVNLLWVGPRLAKDGRALRLLRKTVAAEAVLAVLVLGSVALMTSLEPARQVAAREGAGQPNAISLKGTAGRSRLEIDVEPARAGVNRFLVSVRDEKGTPADTALVHVSLLPTYLNADLKPFWQSAEPVRAGEYLLDKELSVAGPWKLDVLVQDHEGFDATTSFQFDVLAKDAPLPAAPAPGRSTANLLWGIEIGMIGVLVLGVWWVMWRPLRRPP